jgi:hypothetical protein
MHTHTHTLNNTLINLHVHQGACGSSQESHHAARGQLVPRSRWRGPTASTHTLHATICLAVHLSYIYLSIFLATLALISFILSFLVSLYLPSTTLFSILIFSYTLSSSVTSTLSTPYPSSYSTLKLSFHTDFLLYIFISHSLLFLHSTSTPTSTSPCLSFSSCPSSSFSVSPRTPGQGLPAEHRTQSHLVPVTPRHIRRKR